MLITKNLLLLQWKSARRSSLWQKNLALNIVIGFFVLLLAVEFAAAGYMLGAIFADQAPGQNALDLLNGGLVYFFLVDLLIRFLAQPLPRISVDSFRHLPVRKSTLVRYMVLQTVPNVLNLLPFVFLIPASFSVTGPDAGSHYTVNWLVMLLILVLAGNFFATWLKRLMGWNPWMLLAIAAGIAGIVVLDRIGMIPLFTFSAAVFRFVPANPVYMLIPAAWLAGAYWLHARFLSIHLYPDEVSGKKRREISALGDVGFLRSFGLVGTFMNLEMKLFVRNKRTRTILFMIPVFILYGLFFFRDGKVANSENLIMFIGLFMTGGFMINYTNYAFGYESIYFDALLSKSVDFRVYIRVKYTIAVIEVLFCYLLTVPYILYGIRIFWATTAMALFNVGIVVPLMLWLATGNSNRMDLSRGGAFNYQGMGVSNWLSIIPAFLLPLGISLLCKLLGYPSAGLLVNGVIGCIGLICSGYFIHLIYKRFASRRYSMAAGFREK